MASAALDLLSEVFAEDGAIHPDRLSDRLRVTRLQLAAAIGLSKDAVTKTSRLHAPKTQARLRDVIEILNRVRGWAGSDEAAFAWYRSSPLPSFGDLTAEDLVKQGRAEAVKRYISRIAAGGHA
ncbi:antitoxin Xre/MbcA/ParS toxin-binding domain-containing protein [Roseicella aquatilis]|uniref:DUF2384 domain-containing protein n=1 Tax=Roseicella aquatilis TaxID=2527868 RepID=A0A4V2WJN6_9PROT|nr:antitoxin Xre/MbcA/ParS toxin-binding domain-containing protein [Roseicella aquatilis]TCZ55242.1 DUF2384 domain-containing protein [Roseicella aquatilis]